jgi:hypothetical protein
MKQPPRSSNSGNENKKPPKGERKPRKKKLKRKH